MKIIYFIFTLIIILWITAYQKPPSAAHNQQENTIQIAKFIKSSFPNFQDLNIAVTQGNVYRYYLKNSITPIYSGNKQDPGFYLRRNYNYQEISNEINDFDIIIITSNSDFNQNNFNFLSSRGYNLALINGATVFFKDNLK